MTKILDDLTAKERRLIDLLANWHGPDVPNAGALTRLSDYADASGVRWALRRLAERGLVTLQSLRGGTLTVPILTDIARAGLKQPVAASPLPVEIISGGDPLIGFPISCGGFEEANPERGRELESARDMFTYWDRDRDHLLFAQGDSMVDDYFPERSIYEGDWVQYRTGIKPANGEVVYAEYQPHEGERVCQLKEFSMDEESGLVTLTPFNPTYSTITLQGEKVTVLGVVIESLTRRNARGRRRK